MTKSVPLKRLKRPSRLRRLKNLKQTIDSETEELPNKKGLQPLFLIFKKIIIKKSSTHPVKKIPDSKEIKGKKKEAKADIKKDRLIKKLSKRIFIIFKSLSPLLFLGIFISIISNTPPPASFASISLKQFSLFFVPLYLFLTSLFFLLLNSFKSSLILSSAAILIAILKGLSQLNLITGISTLIITIILLGMFRRRKDHQQNPALHRLSNLD